MKSKSKNTNLNKDSSGTAPIIKVLKAVGATISLFLAGTIGYLIGSETAPHPEEHKKIIHVGEPVKIDKEIKIGDTDIGKGSLNIDETRNVTVKAGGGVIDVPDGQGTIENIVGGEVYVVPHPEEGYIVFKGPQNATGVLKDLNLNISNLSATEVQIVLGVDKTNNASGIAKVTTANNTTFYINLNESQVHTVLDRFDNLKIDGSQKAWIKEMVGRIGPKNIETYKHLLSLAHDLGITEDLFGQSLDSISEKVITATHTLQDSISRMAAENYTAGQKLILDKYAATVARITGMDVTPIIKDKTPTNATIELENILTNYITNAINDNRTAAGKEAEEKVLNIWRADLWNNYSAWLTSLNITYDDLNKTDAQGLWNYTQRVVNALVSTEKFDANADAIVIKYGTNGTQLDTVLNQLAGAGRFSLNFTYDEKMAKALDNLTAYLEKRNMSLPYNITEIYNTNHYSIRITDTRDNGGIAVVYDTHGRILPHLTKILTSELMNGIKKWAKDYGFGGSGKDE
ncbi:MAG: hypothetical protein QW063_02345 [Candidatus Nanoarchaeia archaeon]